MSVGLFSTPKQTFQSVISGLCTKRSFSVCKEVRMEQSGTNF